MFFVYPLLTIVLTFCECALLPKSTHWGIMGNEVSMRGKFEK